MTKNKKPKLARLFKRYKRWIIIGLLISLSTITASILIYAFQDEGFELSWEHKLADFLMTVGVTILGAGLIGGGIGGSINFIFEEFKKEEEEVKERLKAMQESSEKRKLFVRKIQNRLQDAYDNVELARILIKSHRSGKTYGEQIRGHIIPSLIGLQDIVRKLNHANDKIQEENLRCLEVSLHYMMAYLSVLIEEFEASYLKIANLQNYQDALTLRMRELFTEVTEGNNEDSDSLATKKKFLDKAEEMFGNIDVPSNIEVVWQAMEELDYIWDFMDELRNSEGKKSLYNQFFLRHYAHCNRILKAKDGEINKKLTSRKSFIANLEELQRIEEKKHSEAPLTNQDNLTRRIMQEELHFDVKTCKRVVPEKLD